jgi:ER membrane protein complex subunit 1
MRASTLASALATFSSVALAVFTDEAYNVDYQYALLGQPIDHSTFFTKPYASSKATLIYTLSDHHVIGAVNPKDGAIVWRQPLHPKSSSTEGFLRAGQDQDIVVSAHDDEVAAWVAADGKLAWRTKFPASMVRDLQVLELHGANEPGAAKDVLVLLKMGQTNTILKLDGRNGGVKWKYSDERLVPH